MSAPVTCRKISLDFVLPGWGCCKCNTYSGLQRSRCPYCLHPRCGELATRAELIAYAEMLESEWPLTGHAIAAAREAREMAGRLR